MTWGHFVSKDLVFWEDRPFALYAGPEDGDKAHVFSGSTLPKGYKDLPTMIYSGIPRPLPQWQDNLQAPVVNLNQFHTEIFFENQMLAVSEDDGATWKKVPGRPALPYAPPGKLEINGAHIYSLNLH